MNKKVKISAVSGKLRAISSKSYAHRLLICAFLSNKKIEIQNITFSQDVLATLSALNSLGAKTKTTKNSIIFLGQNNKVSTATLDCAESGSTLRFCLPLVSALGVESKFIGSKTLLSRPNDKLIKCLTSHGVKFNDYSITGKLSGGEYKINASISSQYISGLLMSLPLLKEDSALILEDEIVSSNYIDITLEVLKSAGIVIDKISQKEYKIYGNQKYNMPRKFSVNGDWSNSAIMLVAGALKNNSVKISGLKNDAQGDKLIIEILKKYGAIVEYKNQRVLVRAKDNFAFSVDLKDAPDLAPIVSVLMATSCGKCTIKGVQRLKIKESNRLDGIIKMLGEVGVKTALNGDELTIFGQGLNLNENGTYYGDNDHRMIMSQAILCLVSGGTINGVEGVKKSYPNFFSDLESIGGIHYDL